MDNPYESPRIMADSAPAPAVFSHGIRVDAIAGLVGAFLGLMLSPRALDVPELTWRWAVLATVGGAVSGVIGSYLLRSVASTAHAMLSNHPRS